MTKYLITGGNGFIGKNLINAIDEKKNCINVWSTIENYNKQEKINSYNIDLTNFEDVKSWLETHEPEVIIHLAAKSIPTKSWDDPYKTFQVNTISTMNLIDSIKGLKSKPKKILFAGTSAQYKNSVDFSPIEENASLMPNSPYAISKIAAEQYLRLKCHDMKIQLVVFRPFYFIGPHKTGDFCSDVAKQIILIERGEKKNLEVGNIDLIRDFLDIRDGVDAIKKLVQNNESFLAINICSGIGIKLSELIKMFISESNSEIVLKINNKLIRPNEDYIRIGSASKLTELGWQQKYEIKQTIKDILKYWRNKS